MKILNETLDYHDLENQLLPEVSVDEYAAKMGKDEDIVTIAFTVNSRAAGKDLVTWFERGYEYILDSQISDGEVVPGKYIVFVELDRKHSVPRHLCELLSDLETLTALKVSDYTIKVDGEDYDADQEVLSQVIILTPHKYRISKESELNEMRERAGIEPAKIYTEQDSILKDFLSKAGL